MKIGRLFIGAQKTNEAKKYTLASWRYKSGYWRWAIWWRPYFHWMPKIGPGYSVGKHFTPGGRGYHGWFSAWVCIPLIGEFSIATQPYSPNMR